MATTTGTWKSCGHWQEDKSKCHKHDDAAASTSDHVCDTGLGMPLNCVEWDGHTHDGVHNPCIILDNGLLLGNSE